MRRNLARTWEDIPRHELDQESMKVREVIPHIGPIPIVIPPKLFLDLLRDPVFPRGLTDSQSYVPIFTNVDSRANCHAMICVVRENEDI